MAFCFNFPNPQNKVGNEAVINESENLSTPKPELESSKTCGFLGAKNSKFKKCTNDAVIQVNYGSVTISYYSIKSFGEEVENKDLLLAEKLKSDLIPGKYEGGFKIWESSFDLVEFIIKENCIKPSDNVLELGCGAGLPGIVAYLKGANVTFQDFNSEVLDLFTIPTVLLNTSNEELFYDHCQFLYGDWNCIREKYFSNPKDKVLYDVILTSETIYEKSCLNKLLDLMKSALKPNGVIYVAAKIHYFGVGGGVVDFEELVKIDNTFVISTVSRIMAGVERQILKLKFILNN